jgi:hypothetical protein
MIAPTRESIKAEYAARIAAAEQASLSRLDAAFVDVPFVVAGSEIIRAMCLPDYLALIVAGNAHVCGHQPPADATDEQVEQFWALQNAQLMWVLSPEFSRDTAARNRFLKRVGGLPFHRVCEDLTEYLRDTFADAPRRRQVVGAAPRAPALRVSFAATWYHRFGAHLHWSRAEIRATPLRELFQLHRVIEFDESVKAASRAGRAVAPSLMNDEVDHLWGEMLDKINALQAQATGPAPA